MAYKEVQGSSDFAPTHDFEEADTIEGIYKGKKTDVGPNKSRKYLLEQPDGQVIEVWGSTVLDNKMDNVGEGQKVQIRYLGKPKGKNYKDFFVGIDE